MLTSGLTSSSRAARLGRTAALLVTAILVPLIVLSAAAAYRVVTTDPRVWFGIDLEIMRELGRRWIETGTMYLPYQLAGPYSIDVTPESLATTPALYPPAAGPVFAAISLLPWPVAVILWWGIPLGLTAFVLVKWRPTLWTWPLIALCLVHPMSSAQVMVGGTSMVAMGLVAGGLLVAWPAAVILLKPTLVPFALIGIRHRSWWLVAGLIAFVTLIGPWRDYITVAQNASESGNGVLYSLGSYPMLLIPVFAWLGRTTGRPST